MTVTRTGPAFCRPTDGRGGMQELLPVLALLVCLVKPLTGAEQRPRLPTMRFLPDRRRGVPVAVALGSLFMPMPMELLSEDGITELRENWAAFAALAACPLVSYALCRLVAPERLKPRVGLLAARGLALPALVVAAETAALDAGVPSLRVAGPLWIVSFAVTAAFLGCLRILDDGYFPLVLLWSTAKRILLAAAAAYWILNSGGTILPSPRTAPAGEQLGALLLWSVAAMAGGSGLVALWRLVRWLRLGPPAGPPPPGVRHWPPRGGQVWTAECTHDDDTYKERPVVVLESTPRCVRVLGVTSQDKSGRTREYLRVRADGWQGALSKDGWLNLVVRDVPYSDFLWRRGACPDRVWNRLCDQDLVREPRPAGGPAPGFALRHLFWSAMNAHAGRDARTAHDDGRRAAQPAGRRPWRRAKEARR